jgi:hypothetical protein
MRQPTESIALDTWVQKQSVPMPMPVPVRTAFATLPAASCVVVFVVGLAIASFT